MSRSWMTSLVTVSWIEQRMWANLNLWLAFVKFVSTGAQMLLSWIQAILFTILWKRARLCSFLYPMNSMIAYVYANNLGYGSIAYGDSGVIYIQCYKSLVLLAYSYFLEFKYLLNCFWLNVTHFIIELSHFTTSLM